MFTRLAASALVTAMTLFGLSVSAWALPDTDNCVQAQEDLDVALAAVLDLSPDLLGVNDTAAELTAPVLIVLKSSPLAGEGAQAVIQVAIDALAAVEVACADPTPTPTPEPTPEPTPPPDPQDGPFESCAEAEAAGADPPLFAGLDPGYSTRLDADLDGEACEDDDGFSQVGEIPQGGVATGGGPF
jgi:hypothetical protein